MAILHQIAPTIIHVTRGQVAWDYTLSLKVTPNFVATVYLLRLPWIALPTRTSFKWGPYMSEVSRCEIPSSSALHKSTMMLNTMQLV